MNTLANSIGYLADLLFMVGGWLNNIAVKIKMSHFANTHPSAGGSNERN